MRSQTESVSITITEDEARDIISAICKADEALDNKISQIYPFAGQLRKLLTSNFLNKQAGISWVIEA